MKIIKIQRQLAHIRTGGSSREILVNKDEIQSGFSLGLFVWLHLHLLGPSQNIISVWILVGLVAWALSSGPTTIL